MVKAGYGDAVQRIKGKADMAASLENSTKQGKRRTKKTKQQELEILQQQIANCKKAGIKMGIKRMYEDGGNNLTLVFGADGDYQHGNLVWVG